MMIHQVRTTDRARSDSGKRTINKWPYCILYPILCIIYWPCYIAVLLIGQATISWRIRATKSWRSLLAFRGGDLQLCLQSSFQDDSQQTTPQHYEKHRQIKYSFNHWTLPLYVLLLARLGYDKNLHFLSIKTTKTFGRDAWWVGKCPLPLWKY